MPLTQLICIASILLSDIVSAAGSLTGRIPIEQNAIAGSSSALNRIKTPGESPAYYCSDPSNDLFKIRRLDFIPINPRM